MGSVIKKRRKRMSKKKHRAMLRRTRSSAGRLVLTTQSRLPGDACGFRAPAVGRADVS